jgi:hypothetical protein
MRERYGILAGMAHPTNRDPRIAALVAAVEDVPLARYEDVTFENENIWLDGGEYVRCRFINCRITVELGRFLVDDTLFDSACRFRGGAPANRWLAFTDYIRGLVHTTDAAN